ncbi:hypothetical protein G6N82_01585 [Altererythrobacter sp. BO-6]|uniref:hypothetical protein n=1 Tax=Altererythrobacter sp. BO-6 TaxID=2604537 RepID=UPI0013E185BC|nr:hypothetical protein [Altererythrobacter sp. BO-6]QIG53023.1 hypothetical protein G6N82_01585 [Altererythrobacter sp. BO-6]
MASEDKRNALRQRIETAQNRLSENPASNYAREAADQVIGFAKANPLVVLAGAVAVGLTLGSLSQRGKKAAAATGVFRRFATDAAIAFAVALYERASHRSEEEKDQPSG